MFVTWNIYFDGERMLFNSVTQSCLPHALEILLKCSSKCNHKNRKLFENILIFMVQKVCYVPSQVRICANDFSWKLIFVVTSLRDAKRILSPFLNTFFLYLCKRVNSVTAKLKYKRHEEKMKWSSLFCLVPFRLRLHYAGEYTKCPINFGITRYGPLITIIMWCHWESTSESNEHVYAITFWPFSLVFYRFFFICKLSWILSMHTLYV